MMHTSINIQEQLKNLVNLNTAQLNDPHKRSLYNTLKKTMYQIILSSSLRLKQMEIRLDRENLTPYLNN
jgi:hypothetical protein